LIFLKTVEKAKEETLKIALEGIGYKER